jgi:hypothetical protein
MTYGRENYASPSGINMAELLRVRGTPALAARVHWRSAAADGTRRWARRLMHQGGDLVIGERRQLRAVTQSCTRAQSWLYKTRLISSRFAIIVTG